MRQLKPSTILVLGALLTGGATTAAFITTTPDVRNLRGFLIALGVGAAFGLVMLSPIAFAEKFREKIRRRLGRYGSRVQPRVAFVIALALGYWFASMRHHTFDALAVVAMAFMFIGALFGIVVSIANGERRGAE